MLNAAFAGPAKFTAVATVLVLSSCISAGFYLYLVTLMFNYHDLGHMGVDRAQMNKAVFAALKPGGLYVIADHSGRPGTGISESGTLHRVEEAFLRKEVEAPIRSSPRATSCATGGPARQEHADPPQPKDEFG
jgi:predicted methyltransferase